MPKRPKLLVIGHSHIECLVTAYDAFAFDADVQFLNLRLLEQENKNVSLLKQVLWQLRGVNPECVCLCIGGNRHNILGLIENPVPFCVGAEDVGAVPSGAPDRAFIPNALMRDILQRYLRPNLTTALFDAFPDAHRLCMNAPPPIGDFDHIRKHPGVFRDKLDLGPSPRDLRLHLYHLQSAALRDIAKAASAAVVDVDPTLVDADGFLAPDFFNADPTHGNAAYGAVMLRKLLHSAGAPP